MILSSRIDSFTDSFEYELVLYFKVSQAGEGWKETIQLISNKIAEEKTF